MVQVPKVENLGQRQSDIGRPAYQTATATADAFGAQRGRDFQQAGQAGQAVSDSAMRIYETEVKAQGYEAYTKISDAAREYTNNPESGIYNKKGSQVIGVAKKAVTDFDDLYAKSSQGLGAGAQERLKALWDTKRDNILDNISRHESKELSAYKEEAETATLKTSIDDAIENYNNPKFIGDAVAIGETTIDDSMAGSSPVAIELKKELFRSQVHSGVVNRMAIDNPLGAEQYYKKHKEQISGSEQVAIEKVLEVGTVRAASQVASDQIIQKNATLEEQLNAAHAIKNPKIRDEVVSRVKVRHSEQQAILEERTKETKSEAWKIIVDTKSLDAIPIQQWAALDGATQKTMTDYIERKNDPKTDVRKWKELSDMHAGSPEEFAKVDIMGYVNDLSATDFKDFSEKQQKIINGDNVDSIKVRTYNQIAVDRLESVGIKTTASAGEGDKTKVANFMRTLTDQISAYTKLSGKEPNNQEVENIVDKMLIRGEVLEKDIGSGSFGTDEAFAFELPKGVAFEKVAIPDNVRKRILNDYYKESGINAKPPTEDQIKRVYLQRGAKE